MGMTDGQQAAVFWVGLVAYAFGLGWYATRKDKRK
jgi:hypothetical protein